MDGLSAAASVITIGVTAVQLVKTIDEILKFWKSIEDVPKDFDAIKTDLGLLRSIVQDIDRLKWSPTSSSILKALQQCQSRTEKLLAIVRSFDKGLTNSNRRKRKWSAFKASFKTEDIKNISHALESSKSTLLLALNFALMFEVQKNSVKVERLSSSLQNAQLLSVPDSNDQVYLHPDVRLNKSRVPSKIELKAAIYSENMEQAKFGPPPGSENDVLGNLRETFKGELDPLRNTLQCGCRTSKIYRYQVSHSLKDLIGDISIQYSKLPILFQRYGQHFCCRTSASTFRAIYYFPQWLLQWHIALIATACSLNGVQVMFKTARVRHYREEIFFMAYDGNLGKVKEYFSMGLASPHDVTNTTHTSLLRFAISNEYIDFARFLIRSGADLHCESKTKKSPVAIGWEKILSGGSKSPVALWTLLKEVDEGECLAERHMSRLHLAVLGLTTENLDNAIEASFPNINQPDADGRTALAWAAFRGDFRSVRKLLVGGASPNIPARDGCLPLHMAARAGSLPCLNILKRFGSDIDRKDSCGNTALHYSCKYERRVCHSGKYLRCVKSLLQSGSEIDAEDVTGKTPLLVCVESSDTECALLLLEAGASIHSCTRDGMSLLLAAVFYSRTDMLKLLIEKGALSEKGFGDDAVSLKAMAQSDRETRKILQIFLSPATYQHLLVNAQLERT